MPLERELKIIQDYMYLQKMRFGQRVRYDTDCAPETLDVLVPSFVLQPLVENSIKHGLSKESKGGRIFIRTWMQSENVCGSLCQIRVLVWKKNVYNRSVLR